MESLRNFEDLIVWQKAHQFVLGVYQFTGKFPQNELYGLTSQFRRAAVSIAATIAEVFKKNTFPDKVKFNNSFYERAMFFKIVSFLNAAFKAQR